LKTNTVVVEKVVKDKEGRGQARKEARAAAAVAKAEEVPKEEELKEKEEEMSAAVLNRKCKEVVLSRGRRGNDTKQVLEQLEKLSELSVKYGPRVEIPMLMHTITAQFDLVKTLDDYMETPVWKSCAEHLERVASVLEAGEDESKKFCLGPASTEDDDVMIGNTLGKKKNKTKDAASVGDVGAVDAASAVVQLVNPHTVCSPI
jgi:translation initiation factor 3 subunit C